MALFIICFNITDLGVHSAASASGCKDFFLLDVEYPRDPGLSHRLSHLSATGPGH